MPPIRAILDAEDCQNLFSLINSKILQHSITARFAKLEGKIGDAELAIQLKESEYWKEIYAKLWGQPYGR